MIRDLPSPPPSVPRFKISLTPEQRTLLMRVLAERRGEFDPVASMICIPFASPGYHTRLKGGMVHPTRESLWYAAALLDTVEAEDLAIAVRILEKVLSLQDTNPANATYGIWSWFLEESLAEMAPPDWNWADFCGSTLLEIILNHRHRLSPSLGEAVDAAILHATRSIEHRNVGPDYTNISIMGSFVTLVAAESYGLDALREYALGRLRGLADYTRKQGSFTEYNSPTYTIVALDELARMQHYAIDAEARQITAYLYRVAWEEIAQHFHTPTGQWAGPHSRCYQNFLPDTVKTTLFLATRGTLNPDARSSLEMYRQRHVCPEHLLPLFDRIHTPRTVHKTYLRQTPPVVGTTHLTEDFSLGTVNYGDLWNQRRALLAYWGTAEKPAYLRLQFLHDGYDFSAAWLFSRQEEGRVLAGITFATDGFDRHIHLDPIVNETIEAHDLRLRFELGGPSLSVPIEAPSSLNEPLRFEMGGLSFHLSVPLASWGESEGRWEITQKENSLWLDVVLYSGKPRQWRLSELSEAAMAIAFSIAPRNREYDPIAISRSDEKLHLHWEGLHLSLLSRPGTMQALRAGYSAETSSQYVHASS